MLQIYSPGGSDGKEIYSSGFLKASCLLPPLIDLTLPSAWQDSCIELNFLDLTSDTKSLERNPAAQVKKERDENTYFVGPDFCTRQIKHPGQSKERG